MGIIPSPINLSCSILKNYTKLSINIIEHGVDVEENTDIEYGQTHMHIAAYNGNNMIMRKLYYAGQSVNCRNYDGYVPLMYAISGNSKKAFMCLIKLGADINATDNFGTGCKYMIDTKQNVELAELYDKIVKEDDEKIELRNKMEQLKIIIAGLNEKIETFKNI
jgi:hypothetical protein